MIFISKEEFSYRNSLFHGGPGSHRFPPGSGKRPFQHVKGFFKKRKYKAKHMESKDKKRTDKVEKKSEPKDKKETVENTEVKTDSKPKKEAPGSAEFTKASTSARVAAKGIDDVSKGVDKAWNSLHNAKYGNEDRSRHVRGLTNEELRRTVERIRLDQEYNKLTMPPKSKGYDRTMAALAVLGSVATVTATGLSIAAGVQALRKK